MPPTPIYRWGTWKPETYPALRVRCSNSWEMWMASSQTIPSFWSTLTHSQPSWQTSRPCTAHPLWTNRWNISSHTTSPLLAWSTTCLPPIEATHWMAQDCPPRVWPNVGPWHHLAIFKLLGISIAHGPQEDTWRLATLWRPLGPEPHHCSGQVPCFSPAGLHIFTARSYNFQQDWPRQGITSNPCENCRHPPGSRDHTLCVV